MVLFPTVLLLYLQSILQGIVSKRRKEGIVHSCFEQNYNCVGPFFQNSLSSVVLLTGLQQDFDIRDCSNPKKQTAGIPKGKSTPEVWKAEYGFSFLFYKQFYISGCLVEQKWIWDLFWCGLESAPVWTDLPALFSWSGRDGWVWACSEPQQRHMVGVKCAWLHPAKGPILQLCPLKLPRRQNGFGIFWIYMGFFPFSK